MPPLKGLSRLTREGVVATRADVAEFITINGGTLEGRVESPHSPARRYAFRYQCPRGHVVSNSLYDLRRGRWCKGCAWNRLTHGECVAYAVKHEGVLLTPYRDEIKDTDTLTFQCVKRHTFSRTAQAIKDKAWCRDCKRLSRRVDNSRFVEKAELRGGVFLGRKEDNRCQSLSFRCSAGHDFHLLLANFNRGTWCGTCSSGLGERIVRETVETLFGAPFPKARPAWLEMRPGSYLELDGFNGDIRVAFEHHGRQHYGDVAMRFPTDFRTQMQRDDFKRKLCTEQKVRLIEIPEVFGITPLHEVRDVVLSECRKHSIRIPRGRRDLIPNLDKAYRTEPFDSVVTGIRQMTSKRNGVIVSIDPTASPTIARIPVTLRCERGHEWPTTIGVIQRGHWCRRCNVLDRAAFVNGTMTAEQYEERHGIAEPRGLKIRIEDVKKLATACGLILESNRYVSPKIKLSFRCGFCHNLFPCSYDQLKQSEPDRCPACARARGGLARRHRLEDLQQLARKHGGYLLSRSYEGVFLPLRWWCAECQDSFIVPADSVVQGGWCPSCSRRRGAKKQSATKRSRTSARHLAAIKKNVLRMHWTVASDLKKCLSQGKRVSLTCSHGKPFRRSCKYLLGDELQCDCVRSNSREHGLAKLMQVLRQLGWTLESTYVDGKKPITIRCKHSKTFDRIAAQIDQDSKCECNKRGSSGEKYISLRPNGKFQVNVAFHYEWHNAGTFKSLADAVQARDRMCRSLGKKL